MGKYALEEWKQKGKKFTWNHHEIFYIDENNGKTPLLLIHGFPTASIDWNKVWDQLSEDYRPITLDLLGFGLSDKPQNFEYSIKIQASVVLDLLKKLNVNSFHIMSHDFGDSVAQEIIRRYNTFTYQDIDQFQVLSLCLLNGGIFPEATKHLPIQKLLVGPFGFILSKFLNERKFGKNLSKVFAQNTMISELEMKEYWQLVSRKNGHKIAHKIIKYLKEREEFNEQWIKALKKFKGPMALINGLEDPISGQSMVTAYSSLISTKNIYSMEGIGHYPQLEAPTEFMQLFTAFQGIKITPRVSA